ncbi:LLM class flavin-dependent oxidoreductase [Yinghuangia sp. ASG 101]|uniref:LLM class flavin-dependent oxidoreductase n=1 Tax=Yinghuangia sp. ASG 101 TaxID=2896848 RepID=UPI001E5D5FDD|nr:LLM class flavin-dependent oxidoreductase [Yinghuangia sp. ASG 101]
MQLAVNLPLDDAVGTAQAAEGLGYAAVVAPEGHRGDAASVLGLVAGRTERVALLSGVMQIPARAPGLAALTAATLDTVSGGRFRLGLGVSNPDVSEGWYGVPFDRPLERTREYFAIVRAALAGQAVDFAGEHYRLPPTGHAAEPLRLLAERFPVPVPLLLAAVGTRNVRLAGEIADGWIGALASPLTLPASLALLREGRKEAGHDGLDGFEVVASVPVVPAPDPDTAANAVRPFLARFIGLGAKERNFFHALAGRLGYAEQVGRVHDRVHAGDLPGAAAAIPTDLVDQTSLLGDTARIAEGMRAYAEAGVTLLNILLPVTATTPESRLAVLRTAAEALERSGVAG